MFIVYTYVLWLDSGPLGPLYQVSDGPGPFQLQQMPNPGRWSSKQAKQYTH